MRKHLLNWRNLILFLAVVLFSGNVSLNGEAAIPEPECRDPAVCFDGSLHPCIPLPTSMPVVGPSYSGGYGIRIRSSNCGAKKCYWFFACKCGPGIGVGFCTPQPSLTGASSNSCNIGNKKDVTEENNSILFGGVK